MQLLMGRRTKTLLPTAHSLLKPQRVPEDTPEKIQERHDHQRQYYDRNAKPLTPLVPGDVVRMQTSEGWRPAIVKQHAEQPRSYIVHRAGRRYRRNRRDLLLTHEPPPLPAQLAIPPAVPDIADTPLSVAKEPEIVTVASPAKPVVATPTQATAPVSRVSGRTIKRPIRFQKE